MVIWLEEIYLMIECLSLSTCLGGRAVLTYGDLWASEAS